MTINSRTQVASSILDLESKKIIRRLIQVDTLAGLGTTLATAAQLVAQHTVVTAADGTVGVRLPASDLDQSVTVVNDPAAAATLLVYPFLATEQINAAGAGVAFSQSAGTIATYCMTALGQWYAATTNITGVATSSTTAELDKLHGVTAGIVTASKAIVVDANKSTDVLNAVIVSAGKDAVAGTAQVFPTTTARGKLAITCTDQTGNTTVSVVAGAMAAARTITLRDPGAAASVLTTTDATAAATTATAVEISSLAGQPATVSMASTPASGTCACQFTFKNAAGAAIAYATAGFAYFSNSTGLAVTAATSGATLTNGDWLEVTAGKVGHYVTSAVGLLGVTVTGSTGSYYLTFVMPDGKLVTTGAIVVNA